MKTSAPKDHIDPDKNVISLFDTDILVEVANGRLDLNEVANRELRNRGLDKNGKWIGYHQFSLTFDCLSNSKIFYYGKFISLLF